MKTTGGRFDSRALTYKEHVARWQDCTVCSLHLCRRKVVMARGVLPCEVVFVGEAPGESEDVLGRPFVGPAGHLQDEIIERAFFGFADLRWSFTNLVCCIPRDDDGGKATEPDKVHIKACSSRLREFMWLARPRLVVLVGSLAKKSILGQAVFSYNKHPHDADDSLWLPQNEFLRFAEIQHPAYILRSNMAQRSLLVQRAVVTLQNAVEELLEGHTNE